MDKVLKFALAGGDRRQAQLAAMLARDGHRVYVSYMEKAGKIVGTEAAPIGTAFAEADCVLLPLPALDSVGMLNTPFSENKISPAELLRLVPVHTPVYGGRLSKGFLETAGELGLRTEDYFEREELKIANAAATAEGAVQIAMEETPYTLCGAQTMVIGYGRIGKLLSQKLKAMGAYVTASARKPADMAWIKTNGCAAVNTESLEPLLAKQDIVFNTVPAMVMDRRRLSLMKKGSLCIDLASKPGGVDFEAAAELGVKVIWALSLPGEVAPASSGAAIRDTVYNLLAERGVLRC
ncbi:MAG: dipicolinate synthase subunit DpsA [Clostridiales bacterium]|nr:dipicolinate synthase subunit DpsA [Clostridiales bacterium]